MSAAVTAAMVMGLGAFSAAQAASCNPTTNAGLDTTNVSITSMDGEPKLIYATACAGVYSGNDIGDKGTGLTNLNAGVLGGLADDWAIFGTSGGSGVDNGSGVIFSATAPQPADKGGTWDLDFGLNGLADVFAVILKGANGYAMYLFDLRPDAGNMFGGDYKMTGILNNGNQIAGLSHMTVAVWGGFTPPPNDDPVAPIPLPAAGWLLIGGLGALAAVRRRKKAA